MRMVDRRITGAYERPVSAAIRAAALLFAFHFLDVGTPLTSGAGRSSRVLYVPSDGHHRRRR
jgi:hypothetical protein